MVKISVAGNEGCHGLPVLDESHTDALSYGRVGLLGLNASRKAKQVENTSVLSLAGEPVDLHSFNDDSRGVGCALKRVGLGSLTLLCSPAASQFACTVLKSPKRLYETAR